MEDWTIKIRDHLDDDPVESQSPSTTILMATAEEELRERISRVYPDDPELAETLLSKLIERLPFILPLLCDEQDQSLFDFSRDYYYASHARGPSGETPASSSNASSNMKSTARTSTATSATSANLGDQRDDDAPQKSNKCPRIMRTQGSGDRGPGRRRLRCHFYTNRPDSHTEKTCVLSGYLSIHNLKYANVGLTFSTSYIPTTASAHLTVYSVGTITPSSIPKSAATNVSRNLMTNT